MHAKGTFSRRCGLISDREDMLVRRLPANQARFSVIPRVQHTIDTQEKGFSLRLS
jgi:hypothetical protein